MSKLYLVYSTWPNGEGRDLVGMFRSRERAILFKEDYRRPGLHQGPSKDMEEVDVDFLLEKLDE